MLFKKQLFLWTLVAMCVTTNKILPAASSSTSIEQAKEIKRFIKRYLKIHPESNQAEALEEYEKTLDEDTGPSSSETAARSISEIPFDQDEFIECLGEWIAIYTKLHPGASSEDAYIAFLKKTESPEVSQRFDGKDRYILEYQAYLLQTGLSASCSIQPTPKIASEVKDAIIFGYPPELIELFAQYQRYPLCSDKLAKLFMLWGEPGIGKSSAATILASETGRPLLYVKCASIETEWKSSETVNLHRILDPITLDCQDPWVILLDEIDSMDKKDAERRSAAFTVLQEIIHANENPNITVIATSNYIDHIAESIVSRCSASTIKLTLPGFEARKKIAQIYLEKNGIRYSNEILDYIAWSTGGWLFCTGGLPGREIEAIIKLIARLVEKKVWDSLPQEKQNPVEFELILKRRALKADLNSVISGINFIKQNLYNAGKPSTDEGRLWKKIRNSKEFTYSNLLATINTFNGCASTYVGAKAGQASLELQAEALAFQKEQSEAQMVLQKQQLAFQRETFEWQKHEASVQKRIQATGMAISAGATIAQIYMFTGGKCTIQ